MQKVVQYLCKFRMHKFLIGFQIYLWTLFVEAKLDSIKKVYFFKNHMAKIAYS